METDRMDAERSILEAASERNELEAVEANTENAGLRAELAQLRETTLIENASFESQLQVMRA